ncbi:BadF/BadG/BcrA/BcrD ATPase family protein [Kribbella jejuensis]|uniref:N-acetylglucosamine kinase-like BadF-type ATPase n=1 Tax=Kribbella jejuensis TaxID=236068 RepID=A0A542E7H7_9ACTN|nr:BadF/BadG/BcrA/BcrD ATPase family protein [Kribbella jejuensis]TQJ11277.1 N-acetylglucosamine kinase-like BadF-type ATPase [Kribbella jejuensis]
MSIYLGVDGGGSGTALCLVGSSGEVLAETKAPSCYYLDAASDEGVTLVERALTAAINEITALAGIRPADITFAFLGLPAYGEVAADVPVLDAIPRAVLGHDRYRCDNDMVCGWAGSLGLADGINVISGTGSMTYGRLGDLGVRVGGWGELFGDEGSGYWIGVRGLQAFAQMSDGRLPPGPLLDVLRAHLGLASDLDLIDVVLNRWRQSRREVAALSRVVVQAAQLGDTAALQIVDDAASELVRLVETTCKRLGFAGLVPVSYSGGVLTAPEVLKAFTARLPTAYELREPQYTPVIGAALYAAALVGEPLSQDARRRLQ